MNTVDTSYTETDTHFYAIGDGRWGRGRTEADAFAALRKQGPLGDRYLIYKVPPGTEFYTDGSFAYPRESVTQPEIVKRMKKVGRTWTEVPDVSAGR